MAAEILYSATIPTIKVSILCLYARIFPQKWFKYILWAVGVFCVAYTVAQFLADVLQCVPLDKLWDPTVAGACINFESVIISGGILNIVTDFMILTLPMPLVWQLQVPTAKKRTLSIMFGIGAW